VVVNAKSGKKITAKAEQPIPDRLIVATPEQLGAQPTSGTLLISARSAVVVMEQ
jgi:hypothetical protein